MDGILQVHVGTEKEWRAWFIKNHETEKKVILISHKKHTGKPCISHRQAMDGAICFGWIDTIVKRIDENTYSRTFVKRTDKSRWSNATLSYAKELVKRKLMTPTGMKRYKEGLKKPVIDHGLPRNPDVPNDLQKLLEKNSNAKQNFDKWPPSRKRNEIWWIMKAKRQETIDKRIKEVFERARDGKKLL